MIRHYLEVPSTLLVVHVLNLHDSSLSFSKDSHRNDLIAIEFGDQ